jgi:hypothetical protein
LSANHHLPFFLPSKGPKKDRGSLPLESTMGTEDLVDAHDGFPVFVPTFGAQSVSVFGKS